MVTTLLEGRLGACGWSRISLLTHRRCWDGLGGGNGSAGKEPDSECSLKIDERLSWSWEMTPERQQHKGLEQLDHGVVV